MSAQTHHSTAVAVPSQAGPKTAPATQAQQQRELQALAPRRLELLAPAKDLEVGRAAILAGADAVYIGGPGFGARAAAGNSLEDIAELCAFAHRFGARVYLTVNTLLYDEELEPVERMIAGARTAGVDALIVQDPALLSMSSLADMEIHASTQMNVDTKELVDFCRSLHFAQIVLPREFSLEQIREFCHAFPETRFEVFVSGAMCVSVSGICYISELMTGRSANRGACAQICRLPMTLYRKAKAAAAKDGPFSESSLTEVAHGHLLSMKDNLRLAQLEDLVEAGASSFKIEGRLKDRDYVVNQVSAFRKRLDRIIAAHPERYARASLGFCTPGFTPDLFKTFNRGFTHAYLQGDNTALVDVRTPKNLGEELGVVRAIQPIGQSQVERHSGRKAVFGRGGDRGHLQRGRNPREDRGTARGSSQGVRIELKLQRACTLSNGDSFTFFTDTGELTGFRVNRISPKQDKAAAADKSGPVQLSKGSTVYMYVPKDVVGLHSGVTLYRNVDTLFIKSINMPQALSRQVPLHAKVAVTASSISVSFGDEYGRTGSAELALPFAQKEGREQGAATQEEGREERSELSALKPEVMVSKLQKLGSPYVSLQEKDISLEGELGAALLPLSAFNQLRREAFAHYEEQVSLTRVQARAVGVPYLDSLSNARDELLYTPLSPAELQALTFPERGIDPRLITNAKSRKFYEMVLGVTPESSVKSDINADASGIDPQPNPELPLPPALRRKAVMTCRNCLIKNHALCHKEGGSTTGFILRIGKYDFDIVTDCRKCLMYLLPHHD